MKKFIVLVAALMIFAACNPAADAAALKDGVNNGVVLYLMNNQPKDSVNFSVNGFLFDRAGVPEYYDLSGNIPAGSCIGILSNSKNIVGDCAGDRITAKKSHLEVHFFTDADKAGRRVYIDGVNSRKSKQFGALLNTVEQDYLYPFDYTWVWNTNNNQHNINFGPMQMTRTLKYSSLSSQIALDNVLSVLEDSVLDGRAPVGIIYFPIQAQIIGSITCYYYNTDGSVSIVDSPQFFDNVCKTKGYYSQNNGKKTVLK